MQMRLQKLIIGLLVVFTYANANEDKNITAKSTNPGVQRDFPPMFAFQRQLGYGSPYSNGYGGMAGMLGDNVNFDFQCKCQARSSLLKNMQTPLDANQAAQQQIQQLQEQIQRLQQQLQRSTSGKSSFEQFAQMLSQADGLECNCSGSSMPNSMPYGRGSGGPGGFSPYGMSGSYGGGNFNSGQYFPPTGAFGYSPMQGVGIRAI